MAPGESSQAYLQDTWQTRSCGTQVHSQKHGAQCVPHKPAADGHQARYATRAAQKQEVLHTMPPAPLKTTLSFNKSKTLRLETGPKKKN